MDLTSVAINTNGVGTQHTIKVVFSEIGFTQEGIVTGTSAGNATKGTVEASAYYSTTNNLGALDTLIGTTGPMSGLAANGSFTGTVSSANPYSLSQVMLFTTNANGDMFYTGDYALTIPEPTSMALVGLSLLGLGAASRRKRA